MDYLIAVPAALALMGGIGLFTGRLFHHTHPAGQTCGWSGCQAKES